MRDLTPVAARLPAAFWSSPALQVAVARSMHRQSFSSDAAADRAWETRKQDRCGWINRAPRIIEAVRLQAEEFQDGDG